MSQQEHSSTPQSSDEQISQNDKSTQQQGTDTIDTCTMDPCPMKMKSKGDQPVKCPDCGKMQKVEAT